MTRHRRPQGFQRTDRVADQIQRLLAQLMLTGTKDPRLTNVTIQEVRVSRDFSFADVYFTVLGGDAQTGEAAQEVLQHAAGFFRSSLAGELNTRIMPQLRFHYDRLSEQASNISRLIDGAIAEDRQRHREDPLDNGED